MGRSRREILEEGLEVMNRHDIERLRELVTPDYVEEYPQSGERVVGPDNLLAMMENYPGGLRPRRFDVPNARLVGEDEQYLVGPSSTVLHMTGSGDTWTAVTRVRYPDGMWHVVMFVEFRGDRIARMTDYFAPEFPAPEWRAQWVERIKDRE